MRFPQSIAKNAQACTTGLKSKFAVVLGSQWGDEGKGKLVDILSKDYDVCARFNGGANAGHTVVADGHKYAFHLLPCGILYPTCVNLLGNGVVVNIQSMFEELE
jgi:adenylosuccinate synthase